MYKKAPFSPCLGGPIVVRGSLIPYHNDCSVWDDSLEAVIQVAVIQLEFHWLHKSLFPQNKHLQYILWILGVLDSQVFTLSIFTRRPWKKKPQIGRCCWKSFSCCMSGVSLLWWVPKKTNGTMLGYFVWTWRTAEARSTSCLVDEILSFFAWRSYHWCKYYVCILHNIYVYMCICLYIYILHVTICYVYLYTEYRFCAFYTSILHTPF